MSKAAPPMLQQHLRSTVATNGYRIKRPIRRCSKPFSSSLVQQLSTSGAAKLASVKQVLQTKKRIIVISGAGISVDAGIPDFRTMQNSGEAFFDISAYNSPEATERLHNSVRALSRFSAQASPTQFHYFLDRLAQSGRLLRHFTQNVDCIERQLSQLWEKTVQLHGRIDQAKCHLRSWNGALLPQWFCGPDLHDCPRCEQVAVDREKVGKRRRGVGRLRPNVVLYGEDDPDGDAIGRITESDLRTGPNVVLVVGTGLKVPGARRLVKELCRAAKYRNGFTNWASKDAPPRSLGIAFDAVFRCDCDDLASLL